MGGFTHPGSQVTHRGVEQREDIVLQHQLHLFPVHPLLWDETCVHMATAQRRLKTHERIKTTSKDQRIYPMFQMKSHTEAYLRMRIPSVRAQPERRCSAVPRPSYGGQ